MKHQVFVVSRLAAIINAGYSIHLLAPPTSPPSVSDLTPKNAGSSNKRDGTSTCLWDSSGVVGVIVRGQRAGLTGATNPSPQH